MRRIRSILSLSVLILGSVSAEAALPRHWVDPSASVPASASRASLLPSLRAWKATRADRSEAASDFDSYLSATEALAQSGSFGASRQPKRPWYLQSLKAEIGVEAEGQIGFLGMGGEAAVELIWTRNPKVVAKLVEEAREKGKIQPQASLLPVADLQATEAADIEASEADAVLDTSMTDSEVVREIDAIVAGLEMHPRQKGTGPRILDLARARRELLDQVRRVRPALEALASTPDDWSWQPYKFQLQLFVQAEGKVAPIVEVGAVTRVRIEWSIVRKPVATPGLPSVRGLSQLVREMDRLAALTGEQRPFALAAFKAGVGFGGELDLGVAELKGHAIGSAFFKRVRKPSVVTPMVAVPRPLVFVTGDAQGVEIPAERLARGIGRAAEIVDAITTRAERHEARAAARGNEDTRQFRLGAVEVELELSASGDLVLPSVSKLAAVELFFVRGGFITQGGAN